MEIRINQKNERNLNFFIENFPSLKGWITLDKYIESEHIHVFESFDGDDLVGAIMLTVLDRVNPKSTIIPISHKLPYGHINYIFISPNWRRKGVAKELISSVIDYLKSKDCDVVVANVEPGNIPSEKLWLSLGFNMNEEVTHNQWGDRRTFYNIIKL